MSMIDNLFSLEGKTAVVTGASSGLGNHMARVLHEAGATVVVAARRLDRLEDLAKELGDRIIPVACDVGNDDDCAALIDVARKTGAIDILINNAGIGDVGPAEDEKPARFRQVIEINLNAVFVLSAMAGKIMLAQGSGSIINIASVLGMVASTPIKQAGYCASKGAVISLTRELAAQWARKGVRVNAIAPGWFRSELTADMFDDEGGARFIKNGCPIARPGNVEELDGALLFLASSASSYVIGQTLAIDGGWSIQ